ncbi:FkbM family methyltransferase, partial [Candidatus Pelagibacter sp.]|nr:FkbM family methyltransferase [Candidatus Pelagibacter sp.]
LLNLINLRLVQINKKYLIEKNLFFSEKIILKEVIKSEKPIIIDVGGHLGSSTSLYKKLFPSSNIYVFEPANDNFKYLKNKFKKNTDIKIFKKAIGNQTIKKDFYIFSDYSSGNSLIKSTNNTEIKKKYKVDIIKLDNFCKKNKISSIDYLKLDTQGNEFDCLIGAKKLIRKNKIKFIKCEFMFHNFYDKSDTFNKVNNFLYKNNFLIRDICLIKKSIIKMRTNLIDVIYELDIKDGKN